MIRSLTKLHRWITPYRAGGVPDTRRTCGADRVARICGWALTALALAVPVRGAEPSTPTLPRQQSNSNVPPAVPAPPPQFQELSDVVYIRRDKLELKADVYVPNGAGPFPGVLMVHGGAWRGGSKRMAAFQSRELAKRGYSVVAINYRLAPDYKFPAQLEDCRDAVRFMRKESARYKIDSARVGACGYSAGGHLVCLLGAEDDAPAANGAKGAAAPAAAEKPPSTRLQAVVAGGSPTDFRRIPEDAAVLSYWLGGTRRQKPELYLAASPLALVKANEPPMFLYHGEDDHLVPSASSVAMVAALKAHGVSAEMYLVHGAGHIGAYLDREAFVAAMVFLDRTLKAAPAAAAPVPAGAVPAAASPVER